MAWRTARYAKVTEGPMVMSGPGSAPSLIELMSLTRTELSTAARLSALNTAMLSRMTIWARRLRRDGHAIYLASRDPRVPWYAKALAIAVAGYALSPIDLIPDFIPILGYLDDLIIVPFGIWLVVSLIPEEIMAEYRIKACEAEQRPSSIAGMVTVIVLWISGASMLGWIGFAYWGPD